MIHIHNTAGLDDDGTNRDENITHCLRVLDISADTDIIHNAVSKAGSPVKGCSMRERPSVRYYEHYLVRMTGKKLRRLRNVKIEDCKLAIGPSQQYEGGEELYLDQEVCK